MEVKMISIQSSFDQAKLHGDLCYNDSSIKALVVIFHGMSEHRFRYRYFAEQLVNNGYAVLVCDHRGHGESGEILGYFASENGWLVNLEDLHCLIKEGKKKFPELPIILLGHSMGALFARSFLKRYQDEIAGLILVGTPADNPLATIGHHIANIIAKFKGEYHRSKLLDNMSFGSFNKVVKSPKTRFDWISKNEENVNAYISDEKCGFIFTIKGFKDVTFGLKDVYHFDGWRNRESNLPIAFFSGAEDPCSCMKDGFTNAVTKLKSFGYKNIQTKLYPELRHEILNEKERDIVMKDIIEFIDKIVLQ